MTTVLAFDTSQQWCSISIAQDDRIINRFSQAMAKGQTEMLLPKITQMLMEVGLKTKDVDKIVTVTGPGSFTGLRVGLASAQGLGLALGVPVLAMNSFRAYACASSSAVNRLVVIDSQKKDVYCQLFNAGGQPLKEPMALMPEDVFTYAGPEPFVITGSGLEKLKAILTEYSTVKAMVNVSPGEVCDCLCLLGLSGKNDFFEDIYPVYLKEPLTTQAPNENKSLD